MIIGNKIKEVDFFYEIIKKSLVLQDSSKFPNNLIKSSKTWF